MITTENYFSKINKVDFTNLPEALKKGNEFVIKATNNGASWTSYTSSEAIKKTIDIYMSKLNEVVGQEDKAKPSTQKPKAQENVSPATVKNARRKQKEIVKPNLTFVERIPDEIRFIRRFVNLKGKTKTKEDILRFINALQKSILEKKIRKTSPYAKEIVYMQGKLLDTFNNMKNKISLEINEKTLSQFKEIIGGEKVYPSIQYLKKYVNMNGKPGMKEKAKKLIEQMEKAVKKKKIDKNDTYATILNKAYENLRSFLKDRSEKILRIESRELNGIEEFLGCACQNLNGVDAIPEVMNSMDFADLQFDTLGFTGKWLELIGDPSSNFTAMVFGKPKMGKSYLCVDFAGYLARNHGKVLYVAKEEGLDMTLQKKLDDKNVKHPNLFVASVLPDSLAEYDFIFLDSVSKLGLSPEDLNKLKVLNPTKSFIFIFQTTKQGNFRGANSFQHDVDVVIEVPASGKAVQMGRFNQGGEMQIFEAA